MLRSQAGSKVQILTLNAALTSLYKSTNTEAKFCALRLGGGHAREGSGLSELSGSLCCYLNLFAD
jgi:hypothetical protein